MPELNFGVILVFSPKNFLSFSKILHFALSSSTFIFRISINNCPLRYNILASDVGSNIIRGKKSQAKGFGKHNRSVIPLSTQLNYFQEYVGKLKGLVGEKEGNDILHNSLYLVVAGSNDLANTYFTVGLRQKQYDINSYTDLMVDGAADFIQELYKLGARKIGVFGIPPVGCLPFQRTVSGGIFRMCVEEYNEAALLANTKLSAAINDSLSKKLPQSKLVFIDLYDPMLDLIVNPQKYGFEVVEKGCCGTGNIEVLMLCKYGGTCEDDTKYLFWDSYHPTERGYRILVDQMMKKYINSFT
ncbi:GDSL esterase/lipase EXL3-like isoform X2 [Nicotiana sylvestris]|uniref:GDSL esterase/lipase EXL3-like isoform X2 n=1 Tax=Nicotiana tabacum TaxID=4097 RepID=A0A1S4BPA0_TOBAC|nr:PREDICTED: GDSL esterase/lipase EXL3-like isoform X2 [Nicotiana tabacum]